MESHCSSYEHKIGILLPVRADYGQNASLRCVHNSPGHYSIFCVRNSKKFDSLVEAATKMDCLLKRHLQRRQRCGSLWCVIYSYSKENIMKELQIDTMAMHELFVFLWPSGSTSHKHSAKKKCNKFHDNKNIKKIPAKLAKVIYIHTYYICYIWYVHMIN